MHLVPVQIVNRLETCMVLQALVLRGPAKLDHLANGFSTDPITEYGDEGFMFRQNNAISCPQEPTPSVW